jgi:peptidase M28-like protein/PA domain-containing protein
MAARFLAARFRQIGLDPLGTDGFLQPFAYGIRDLGPSTLALEVRGERTDVPLQELFLPLVGSPDGSFAGEAAFVGYGITAPECAWDDYAAIDVRGKVAVALRHEPFANREDASEWLGRRLTRHAAFAEKARNAARHGAVALVVVPSVASFPRSREAGRMPGRRFWRSRNPMGQLLSGAADALPVEELRRHNEEATELADEVFWLAQAQDSGRRLPIPSLFLAAAGCAPLLDPEGAEREILEAATPRSRALPGVRIEGTIATTGARKETANVVAFLRGSDPALAKELVVVGAHYDHVGKNEEGEVWNGADDNASGTAALLEIAAALASAPPPRSVLFVAFGAEEVALLGSFYFVENPPIPVARIVAMVNCDMIGRGGEEDLKTSPDEASKANEVFVSGLASSPVLEPIVRKANQGIDLEITASEKFFDRSDQAAFYAAGIPVLFFNTGEHGDYHGPGDTADKLDYPKAARVARLALRCVSRLTSLAAPPPFVDAFEKAEAWANRPRKNLLLGSTPFLERADL